MILDLSPGAAVTVEGIRYTVDEHSSFHDVDFRLDLVRLVGPTPAHERWLVAVIFEPHLMVLQPLAQEWLAAPTTTISHAGTVFVNLYRGSANRVRRRRDGRDKEGRVDYALFRADTGRVILTVGQSSGMDAWIGATVAAGVVELPTRPS